MPGTPVANISAMKRFVILLMAVTCVASPGGQPPQKRPCIEPEHIEGIRAYLAQNRPRYMRAIFSARVWLDGLRVDPMEVRAWVVAEHSIFYILERHGELRAIARMLVEKVTRSRLRNDSERAEIAKVTRSSSMTVTSSRERSKSFAKTLACTVCARPPESIIWPTAPLSAWSSKMAS